MALPEISYSRYATRPHRILTVLLIPILAAIWMGSPLSDPAGYLLFLDTRKFLGISNAWNVLSNLPFLLIGFWGLARFLPKDREGFRPVAPLLVISGAVLLTAAGSSHFHLDPTPETLFWDRLPMSIAFMATVAWAITEYIDEKSGLRALPYLVALGIAATVNWHLGTGDLRPYVLVQFGGLAAVLLILALARQGSIPRGHVLTALACYAMAKAFEMSDASIFELTGQTVSGHTLKHLMAAAGAYLLLRAAAAREVKS